MIFPICSADIKNLPLAFGPKFKKLYDKLKAKYPRDASDIEEDFWVLVSYIQSGRDIPYRYKPHLMSDKKTWEYHLVNYSSDFLLLCRRENVEGIFSLHILAITDHNGINKVVKSSLTEEAAYIIRHLLYK